MRVSLLRRWVPWIAILLAGASPQECSSPAGRSFHPSLAEGSSQLVPAVPERRPETLHALLINGGGWHEINYRSHVHHLERLLELLAQAGVARERVTVMASDGMDETPDLAVLNSERDPDLWLLPSSVSGALDLLDYVNTEIAGVALQPATPEALEKWFGEVGSKLRGGDTLLLYVTDHGERNESDLDDNTISLWNGHKIGVRQVQRLLDQIDPSVRVVMLMSQCFGGAFANAIFAPDESLSPRGNVCGYFATTAERPAYGCYPENVGRESVGHSHEVFDGLGLLGELQRAHRLSLITDRTPDVPNTSRDFYLRQVLARAAQAAEVPFEEFVDRWLREAWKDRAGWEPEIRLVDHVAHSFGLFSPRSLREFAAEADSLAALSDQIDTYADRWEDALESARQQSMVRFLTAQPDWNERLNREALAKLDVAGRGAVLRELLAGFVSFVREDGDTFARLEKLKQKAEDARAAYYRTEVRIGATLRIRTLLTSIAGRSFVRETGGKPLANDERLAQCESLALVPPAPPEQLAVVETPEPLPQVADDRKLIESVMPSWMGIRYQPVAARPGAGSELPAGAVQIMTVFPDSPAANAQIKVGDIVLGQPGRPFSEPHSIREWTMQSELGVPTALELQRKQETLEVELVPGAFPLELPALPGPPKVGTTAPTLELDAVYRGAKPDGSKPTLLFFWATWCGPCKQSVPELMRFAEQRDVHVVAITDEEAAQLDGFFEKHAEPFPETVLSDPLRVAFQTYGVSGTPTFVLIDPAGVIQTYQRGYSSDRGLEFEGWSH